VSDETRVGQLFCPILSTPASVNKSGKEVPAALMPCREKACALYRPMEKRCVLYEVPDVMDRVSAMRASTDRALTRANATFLETKDELAEAMSGEQAAAKEIRGGIASLLDDLSQKVSDSEGRTEALASKLREAGTRQDRLMGALDREVERMKDEARRREAGRATDEAVGLYHRGDLREALYRLEKARAVTGGTPDLLNVLGTIYARLSRLSEAKSALRACLEQDVLHSGAHVNLGLVLLQAGEVEAAEESIREGLRLDPESGAGWNTLGNLLFRTGRRREGIAAWLRAVEADPGLAPAWENLRRQQLLDHTPFEQLAR